MYWGDFNTCYETQTERYNALQELFEDYPNICEGLGQTFRDFDNEGRKCIDHVFTNMNILPKSLNKVDFSLHTDEKDVFLSDHFGIEFDVSMKPKEIPGEVF